jgi:hypothetical protein
LEVVDLVVIVAAGDEQREGEEVGTHGVSRCGRLL